MSSHVKPLAGRKVVITGVGGIGTAVARQATERGAMVFLVDNRTDVEGVAGTLGAGWTVADVREQANVDRALGEAARALGGIDGLIAVAGGSGRSAGDGPVSELTELGLEQTLRLNLNPPLLCLGAFARLVMGPAAAVLIGSVLSSSPHPLFGTHAYAAAKAGLDGAARAAAGYYASSSLRVNVVAAGLTRTPMSRRAQEDEQLRGFARAKQPLTLDGFVEPEAVADACCWLLAAEQVTGQVLAVDGGWSVSEGSA